MTRTRQRMVRVRADSDVYAWGLGISVWYAPAYSGTFVRRGREVAVAAHIGPFVLEVSVGGRQYDVEDA